VAGLWPEPPNTSYAAPPPAGDGWIPLGLEQDRILLRDEPFDEFKLENTRCTSYEGSRAVRAASGIGNPLLAVGVGRHGTALLDLMVGEPVAMQQVHPN
jgi:hypothetical protein